ncbi:MAG: hypothetical protein ACLQO6_10730 [Desulfomonilaceae bacterium]
MVGFMTAAFTLWQGIGAEVGNLLFLLEMGHRSILLAGRSGW